MMKVEDIVLEPAATIVYSVENGYDMKQTIEEMRTWKPIRASLERLDRAFSLIRDLEPDPRNEQKNELAPAG